MPLCPNFIERLLIKRGTIPGSLLDVGMSGFTSSALLGAGEIKLFHELDQSPGTLDDLADRTGSQPHALENLLRVLQPLGYVEKGNGEYSVLDYAQKNSPG